MRGLRGAALLSVLILLAAVAGLVRPPPAETYEVNAFFPRAIGLFPRSQVKVLGVEVGRVTAVVPVGDRVRVGLRVRQDVRVPRDAIATIVPIALIADRYVQLDPPWTGGPTLRDGDEIPLERGVAPAELDDLLATLHDFLEAIEVGTPELPGVLGRFVTNAEQALAGTERHLGPVIEDLGTVLDVLVRNASSFESTLVSVDRLFGALARRDAEIIATNRGLAAVTSALAQERQALESGLVNLRTLLEESGDLVRTHRRTLEADLATLIAVTDLLLRNQDQLRRLNRWLPVVAEGGARAYDPEGRLIRVRDDAQFQRFPEGPLP